LRALSAPSLRLGRRTVELAQQPLRILVPPFTDGVESIDAERASHEVVAAEMEHRWIGLHAPKASRLGFDPARNALFAEGSRGARVLHAQSYDAILRQAYDHDRLAHPLGPAIGTEAGAQRAAEGLLSRHYRPEHRVLVETAAFAPPHAGRERMHVSWLSGAPAAYALLAHGASAGPAVLDRIATAIAPCGAFWGQWTPEGWRAGWNGKPNRLHARTAAEASLFMLRATRIDPRRDWLRAVRSNLDFALRSQSEDGDFAAYFDACTGDADGREGTAGLAWIPALVEAGGKAELEAAVRAGSYYEQYLLTEQLRGAPEDVPAAPTSEDGYVAVMAYVSLFEATGAPKWLELARRAAEWTFRFRWSYNLDWPDGSYLQKHGFRSRGADLASATNEHLHAYGLICLPELLRLWTYTGDDYFLDRARDNLACFLQDLDTPDGMAPERYFHARRYGPKGEIQPLSHAWCLGLLLHACTHARAWREQLAL
jgi:hypothetical protein